MKPGETIAKSLRRLGGNKGKMQSSSQRWKAKKQKTQGEAGEQSEEDKTKFLKLTELADKVLSSGNMEVYEMTYEKVTFLLKKLEPTKTEIPEDMDNDDALDMFAENFDKGAGGDEGSKKEKSPVETPVEPEDKDTASKSSMFTWNYELILFLYPINS